MAFTATRDASDTMSEMNITPLVDMRIGMGLSQPSPLTPPPRPERELTVEPGDLFRLDGVAMTPAAMESALADWSRREPEGVLKLAVSPDADYQSAATAMAAARRAGVENIGLLEP
jgi:biopolymer transport protein ExbD